MGDRATLGSLAVKRGLVGGPFGSKLGKKDYVSTGVPVIRGQNLDRGRYVSLDDCVYVAPEKVKVDLAGNVATPGDLVFTQRGTLGQVAIMPDGAPPSVISQSQMRLRVDREVADPSYVYYWATSDDCLRQISDRAIVSGVPHINLGILRDLSVPSVPLDEQGRIADVLGAFDDLIDTNRSAVRRVLDLSRALFSDVARKAGTEVRLGDVAVVNPDKVTVGAPDESLRYLDIAGLEDGSSATPPETRWADAPSRARRGAKEGDTLWATVRPNRRGHVLLTPKPDHLVVSTGIAVLRPVEIGPAFLFAATDDELFSEHLTQRADGSAYPAVRADAFKDALIPLPEKTELERFERTMWPIWQAAGELLSEATELQNIRDELLPLLMSGRVTVDEAWEAIP